jgi:hypothetical protein
LRQAAGALIRNPWESPSSDVIGDPASAKWLDFGVFGPPQALAFSERFIYKPGFQNSVIAARGAI